MARLYLFAEGRTEQTFANAVLSAIRSKCPHFSRWLEELEALDARSGG